MLLWRFKTAQRGRRGSNPRHAIFTYTYLSQVIDFIRQAIASIAVYVSVFLRRVSKCERGRLFGAAFSFAVERVGDNKNVRHRRSVDLMARVRKSPVEWPKESRRSTRYWQAMSDEELRRIGRYLRQQVGAGQSVHQRDLDDARAEWRRRHPRSSGPPIA